jgi:ADP-ribose pyrophosphatase YjhB (NUDIX family)
MGIPEFSEARSIARLRDDSTTDAPWADSLAADCAARYDGAVKPTLEPAFSKLIPPGEDRERAVCDHCGFIDYVNPKIVVGAVAAWSEAGAPFGPEAVPLDQIRILLCRRAIMPRRGWWTLPAGFMETGETVAQGALREAREEAGADMELDGVLALYDIPVRSQVQVIHRARLRTPEVEAGVESLEVRLFAWDELPWKALAFHTVSWALMAFEESRTLERFAPFGNPPGEAGWRMPAGI